MLIGNIVLAVLFGLVATAILGLTTAGMVVTLVTVTLLFLVVGLLHFFLWGRSAVPERKRQGVEVVSRTEVQPADLVNVELTEEERLELIELLETSMSSPSLASGTPRRQAERQALRQKLRMFGA
jgi:hypothetical protein